MYERFTDRARNVLKLANQEATRFNHEYIGTEHILLGLIKEGSGVAAEVLKNLTVDVGRVRLQVEKLIQRGPDMVTMGKLPWTPAARRVIKYAEEESWKLNNYQVDTEHILLGLLREDWGVASQILMNLGLRVEQLRREIEYVRFSESLDSAGKTSVPFPEPPTQSSTEVDEGMVYSPQVCRKCGHVSVVRVIWGCHRLFGKNLEDIKMGLAILGSFRGGEKGPAWVCLKCAPQWSDVHCLVMQDYGLEEEKVAAVARRTLGRPHSAAMLKRMCGINWLSRLRGG